MSSRMCIVMLTVVFSALSNGCGLEGSLPSYHYDETINAVIPHLKATHENIARARCSFEPDPSDGVLYGGFCEVALSNGVSDLLNDIHTGIDVIDAVTETDMKQHIKDLGIFYCTTALNQLVDTLQFAAVAQGFGDVAEDYIDGQSLRLRGLAYCKDGVEKAWNETNENQYSGGQRCAVGKVAIALESINLPPVVHISTFSRDDSSSFCPHARLVFELPGIIPDLRWGRD
jgi:hypothetical protein